MPTVAQLLSAVPAEDDAPPATPADEKLRALFARLSLRPVPTGALGRFWRLTGLHAKIGLAYGMHWLRGWFQNAERQERHRLDTHLNAAYRLLETMGYLRGAVMKVGQTLANFPDIVPAEFVDTLERLHFDAPPMHYGLVRELLHDELGGDPEDVFDSFETEAFAAASLGQVHRARLKTGERVAVKVQYPGIARTIRADFRGLTALLTPLRLSREWESVKSRLDFIRRALEVETDYEQEARFQERARALFREDDGIVVPRVYSEFSTRRVLTMEYLEGSHVREFLAGQPPQAARNAYGEKLLRAWYRLFYAGRMNYIDIHPGNLVFMDDGRLGLLDFGCVIEHADEEWELMRIGDRPLTTGRRDERIAFVKQWLGLPPDAPEDESMRLLDEYAESTWRPRFAGGEFDFGDPQEFRRAFDLVLQMMRKRYTRGRPVDAYITRWDFAYRSMLYRLQARIDVRPIAEEEVKATGWDRSDYALSI
ncbi:MAG TPA: AarF/ABC1/UbiB kinase family protein [Planctomycetaceae bacterium]|nr:AarF/ABC1/UbiB kinase family protein [Planctomycetaceae bacterium]